MDTQTLLANFGTIADAPGGIHRIRELILKLAVRGRLVDQLRSEGTQELETTAEGRFLIPQSWSWLRLSDFVEFKTGKTPPTKDPSFWSDEDSTMWVSISDMTNGGVVTESARRVTAKARSEIFKYEPWPTGTLLMSFKLTIGKVSRLGGPAYFNEAIMSFNSGCTVTNEYLFRVLPLLSQSANSKGAIKGKTLNSGSISNIMIPLPPEAEQARIVSKVDDLLALCDRLETAKTKRDALRTATRESALDAVSTATTPDELTQSWELISNNWTTFCNYVEEVDALRQIILRLATRTGLGRTPRSYPVSKLQDISIVSWGNVSLTKSSYVDKGLHCAVSAAGPDGRINHAEHKAYTPVISAIGARCGTLFMPDGDFTAIKNTMTVTPDATRVDNWFLYYALRSSTLPRRGSAQPFLSLSDIKNFEIPIPHDLDEQAEIVRQVDELMLLCDELEVALSQRDALQGRLTSSIINETVHTA